MKKGWQKLNRKKNEKRQQHIEKVPKKTFEEEKNGKIDDREEQKHNEKAIWRKRKNTENTENTWQDKSGGL